MGGGHLHLVLPARNDMRLARDHRIPAVACDLGGVILLHLADIGVIHVGSVEKFGVGSPRHQVCDGDAIAFLDLVADRLDEIVDEGFRPIIDGVECARNEARYRPGNEYLALIAWHHPP